MKKQALGRGLSALIDTDIKPDGGSSINEIEISKIHPNPNQPRTYFDEEALQELANSIHEMGIVSPITLRQLDDDTYQIIAGERRYRASKLAGLDKIPAYIKTNQDEQHVQLMALIENIQREDLNAIEIALCYYKLMEEYSLTQEGLSERVGKKRATIANYLRLLKLPAEIQLALKDKRIDMGHARVLAGVDNAVDQLAVYEKILSEGLSVHATEDLVKASPEIKSGTPKAIKKGVLTNETYSSLATELTACLKAKTQIVKAEKGGKITISFKSDDDLNRLIEIFKNGSN